MIPRDGRVVLASWLDGRHVGKHDVAETLTVVRSRLELSVDASGLLIWVSSMTKLACETMSTPISYRALFDGVGYQNVRSVDL